MSNALRDYIYDEIYEVVLKSSMMDKIEEIPSPSYNKTYVHGQKNGQKVLLEVWFDDELCEWVIEHRETDKNI